MSTLRTDFQTVPRTVRTGATRPTSGSVTTALTRVALGACMLLMATGCSDRALPTSPPDLSSLAARGDANSPIEQFALAQGTFCTDDPSIAPLPCAGTFTDLDIGYIIGRSRGFGPPPVVGTHLFYIFDIGGVNARYWARNGLSPNLPKYRIDGDVTETALPDGRRRVRISARVKHTFTFVDLDTYDSSDEYVSSQRLFGADFFQYPSVDPTIPDLTPVLANLTADIELILPQSFVGYPDLIQVFDAPLPGMELRRLDVTLESDGRLQSAYNGWPLGAKLRLRVRDSFSEFLTPAAAYVAPQIDLTRTGGGPG